MSSVAKKTKQNTTIHRKQIFWYLSFQSFKKASISKCSSLRPARLGFDKSWPTENMRSTLAEDGMAVMYLKNYWHALPGN